MRKNKLTGINKVFTFTLVQTLKTPSVIVATVLLFAMAIFALPVTQLMNGGSDETEVSDTTSIERLVIVDETELKIESWLDIGAMEYEGALPETIEFSTAAYDELVESLEKETEEDWAIIDISYDEEEMMFEIVGVYGTGTDVKSDDVMALTDLITENFQKQMMVGLNVSEDQIAYINHGVEQRTSFYALDEDGEIGQMADEISDGESGSISVMEYMVVLICLVVTILLVSMNGEQVASAVVQEKSSKVVEYLLINVKPFALMVGKVLALFVVTLMQLVLMIAGLFMSGFLYVYMNPSVLFSATDILTDISGEMDEMGSISIVGSAVPLAVLLILAGVLIYSAVAALAGACVSRLEELTESMKTFSFILIIGAYVGLAVVMADLMGSTPVVLSMVVELFPLSSPFLTSAYLLIGRAPLWVGVVALLISICTVIALFWFSSNVYESLIYHKGNRIKPRDLFRMGKTNNKKECKP